MGSLVIQNPATGDVVETVPIDRPETIAASFRAARSAQPAWAAAPLKDRLEAIGRFRSRIADDTEKLAAVLTTETGKPITQSRNELKGLLGRLDFFLGSTEDALKPQTVHSDDKAGRREVITHEPLGVIANISAWNYPYYVGSNVFVPALLAGNAVLYKPSEFATLSGLEIARMLDESGIPRGVFRPVIGMGSAGAALLEQPLDGVFFTGSNATGTAIARALAGRMVKVQLELGGKDPVYVCDDVDVAKAAAAVADGAFYNAGQSCCSVERVYVHERIFGAFVEAFAAEVRRFKIGDPMDEGTYIGPLARAAQIPVLEAQVADAMKKGARVIVGGKRIDRPGHYFAPTVLVDVDHSMAVMREESFGPVIGIMAVEGDGRATELMNDTDYGLTAGVYSPDERRAEAILARMKTGSVYWNCCDCVSPRLPWSGVGRSGIGLTLSTYGIQALARPKAWHLRRSL